MIATDPVVVYFSYIRWGFAWQRPQQIAIRLARRWPVFFVEEPWPDAVTEPGLRTFPEGNVTIVRLDVPDPGRPVGFADPVAASYPRELATLLTSVSRPRVALLATPMALHEAEAIDPDLLVYDAMDNLADLLGAPEGLASREQRLLTEAGLVFAGGRSLYEARRPYRDGPLHCLPSGVEPEHYAQARKRRGCAAVIPGRRPVAGYVGVIDERMDLALLTSLATAMPDWEIRLVGPVVKIDPGGLPDAPNLVYTGFLPYNRLPAAMAEFDVAIMPFALDRSTQQISPTKTLEYLAAGLPVVSTSVPDVVYEYGHVVTVADSAADFAAACRRAFAGPGRPVESDVDALLRDRHWDRVAVTVEQLIAHSLSPRSRQTGNAPR